jgi:8-hydroxy-5-deazaflavin:NADPH oxidoreductase
MKIGIIGSGNVGSALGKIWAAIGHDIVFGVRDPQDSKVRALVSSLGGTARAASVKEAAAHGEVVTLATPWPATQDALEAAGNLGGKILVDCTNPLAPDLSGLTVGLTTSAGEEVARWAKGAKVVKAFNTIGAQNFSSPKFGSVAATMFICGDDANAKTVVSKLAVEMGFDAVDAGPLSNSRLIEPLALLWIDLAYNRGLGPTSHAFKLLRR